MAGCPRRAFRSTFHRFGAKELGDEIGINHATFGPTDVQQHLSATLLGSSSVGLT